ncbi:hypothetical protein ACPESV_28655 [Streptomyces umbrinus]|uniref:hypothetical protein n=1 Tax=Streptomyces umbrinus TaxID=67370 RepID=UPI003C2B50FD
MHIGTFNDQQGGGPRTFAAAVERLPYLAEPGVNAIELMPAAEFPGGFSWGYNPSVSAPGPWNLPRTIPAHRGSGASASRT